MNQGGVRPTRAYRLGKRADLQAATRERIVSAAAGLFLEHGMADASMRAVARAADVARGTVRHHFPNPASLAVAVGELALAGIGLPDGSVFRGLRSVRSRMERLADEFGLVAATGEPWWAAMQREPALADLWAPVAAAYQQRADALIRAALGPLGDDDVAVDVVAMAIGWSGYYALQGRGRSPESARAIAVDLVVPWLERRHASRRARGARRHPAAP